MSHNAFTRAGGVWVNGIDHLNASDLFDFEAKMYKAVNGDDGGTWNPSSPIVVRGAGMDASPLAVTVLTLVDGAGSVSGISSLKALTGIVDAQAVFVRRYGWYVYETPSAVSESLPWVVQPFINGALGTLTQSGIVTTATGLTNITSMLVGGSFYTSNALTPGNNGGPFTILTVTPPNSLTYDNSLGSSGDANNGVINWSAQAPGQWFHELASIEHQPSGVETLDTSGKVPLADLYTNSGAGSLPTLNASNQIVAGYGGAAGTLATLDSNQRLVQPAQYLYEVASTSAMTALVNPPDGLCVIAAKSGLYRFYAGDSSTVTHPIVFADVNNTGRWMLEGGGQALYGTASGFCQLDGSTKVPLSNLYYQTANGLAGLDSGGLVPASQTFSVAQHYDLGGTASGILPSVSGPTSLSVLYGPLTILYDEQYAHFFATISFDVQVPIGPEGPIYFRLQVSGQSSGVVTMAEYGEVTTFRVATTLTLAGTFLSPAGSNTVYLLGGAQSGTAGGIWLNSFDITFMR